jgi:hypothetical protein
MSDIVAEARNWASPQSYEPADSLILELADEIERLRATSGCKRCVDLGHHPGCDEYVPSIGELLGE